jgi:hypothetical protein
VASPTKARGARSRANLKRGGIRQHLAKLTKGEQEVKKEAEKECRKIARRLLLDATYQKPRPAVT